MAAAAGSAKGARQVFETTVVDSDTDNEARFLVLPRRALAHTDLLPSEGDDDGQRHARLDALLSQLELRSVFQLRPRDLIDGVAISLASATLEELEGNLARGLYPGGGLRLATPENERLIAFAEALTFTPLLRFA
jgi:hypothetical protein